MSESLGRRRLKTLLATGAALAIVAGSILAAVATSVGLVPFALMARMLLSGPPGVWIADEPPYEGIAAAIRDCDAARLSRLLDGGADPDEVLPDTGGALVGASALHLAVLGDCPDVTRVLVDAGADLSRANETGGTALFWANAINLGVLIEAGAMLEQRDQSGRTALFSQALRAHRTGDLATIRMLVAAGADVQATDFLGRRAIDVLKGFPGAVDSELERILVP